MVLQYYFGIDLLGSSPLSWHSACFLAE
jgi:hypothetical protein